MTTCERCKDNNTINSKYCKNCGYTLPKQETEACIKEEPKKKNTPFGTKSIIGMVIGFSLMFGIQSYFTRPITFDKALMSIAKEINKNCPIQVDADTRLDNTMTLPENIFQYNYSLVNTEQKDIDTNYLIEYLKPTIHNYVRTSSQMKNIREKKVIINYSYSDKNGVHLFIISVKPEDYL